MSAPPRRTVHAPEIPGDLDQVNHGAAKVTLAGLRGRFVLLEFWTFA